MKTRAEKQQEIDTLAAEFRESPNVVVMGFKGLPVAKDWELRKRLRQAQLKYRVVKNTLAQVAARGTAAELLVDQFKTMTSVALAKEDSVALAKILTSFAKENVEVEFRGAVIEGRLVSAKDIQVIASLPSKQELMSRIMFLLNAPAQRLTTTVQGVARNLAVVAAQVRDQKKGLE